MTIIYKYKLTISFFYDNSKSFLLFYTIDPIFRESHFFSRYDVLYHLLIVVEYGIATLELEKYDLLQMSTSESVEYNIVTSLSCEYHILRIVWEAR
jgi:hypothetical protein